MREHETDFTEFARTKTHAGRTQSFSTLLSLALFVVFTLTLATVPMQAASNLVHNHDFSQGVNEKGAPLYWNVAQDSKEMAVELSAARSVLGEYSLGLTDNDPGGALAARSDRMPVEANHPYRAEVDVWVEVGTAMLYLEFWNEAGTRIASHRVVSKTFGQWETLTLPATSPALAKHATVLLYSDKANVGESYFDHVRLTSAEESQWAASSEGEARDLIADDNQLDYTPAEGTVVSSNPPSFIWIPIPGATHYTLEYSTHPDFVPTETKRVEAIDISVFTPDHTLDITKTWYWRVFGVDARGNIGTPSAGRSFILHPDAIKLPLPSPEQVRARIPKQHPRLFVTPDTLPTIIEKRGSELLFREILWKNLQMQAMSLLFAPLSKEPPHAKPGGVRDINLWRQYTSAVEATNNAETLAFVYMLSGDEEIGEAARKWMLHIASWDPYGATSAAVNDEASMPILHKLSRAYTWAYDALTPEDRKTIQDVMRIRGAEAYSILKRGPFESRPYASHTARQLGFLLEPAIAFMGEIPEAEEWFDYVVRVIFAVYPSWGGDPGGWAEGQAYWTSYVNRALWFVDVLNTSTGLDLFNKAFFRNNGYFKLYTHPPYARISPFGDHADRSPTQTDGNIMRQYAVRHENPHFQWYAEQMGGGIEQGVMGFIRAVLRPPFQVKAESPLDLPPSRYFSDIGWVAMHRRLGDRANAIQFMFKSSPYGSWSHSMADQNTFTLEAYGEPLAISSGYRPFYGSDHHMGWTKTTQAHNGILVNGQGQLVQSIQAVGVITGFLNGQSFDYTGGDATAAYPGLLSRALRHVVYLRPDVFVIFDDLAAVQPSQFSWLLHAYQELDFDAAAGTINVNAPKASLQAQLWASETMTFTQTNEFAVPLDEPMNVAEQWHFQATTTETASDGHFLAVLRPAKADDASRFTAQAVDVHGGQGVQIDVSETEAHVLFRTTEAMITSDRLQSDGRIAAWTHQKAADGLLLIEGSAWAAQNGLQLRSTANIDAELTFTQDSGGAWSTIEGSIDAPHTEAGETVTLTLTLPDTSAVQDVTSNAAIEWEFSDGMLQVQMQPRPDANTLAVKLK